MKTSFELICENYYGQVELNLSVNSCVLLSVVLLNYNFSVLTQRTNCNMLNNILLHVFIKITGFILIKLNVLCVKYIVDKLNTADFR